MTNQRLTPRQWTILMLRCDGKGIKDIARDLCLQPQTVKNHLSGAYRTLVAAGAMPDKPKGRATCACVWAWRRGLVARGATRYGE